MVRATAVKSTVLEAIHLLLGDRWSVSFSDVDFYHVDPSTPIQIKAVLTDVAESLLKDNTFGFWQSGLDAGGGVHQEPEDGLEPCLVVHLTVDESLEPQWEVVRVDGEARGITSSQRRSSRPSESTTEPTLNFDGAAPLLLGEYQPRMVLNATPKQLLSELPVRHCKDTTVLP